MALDRRDCQEPEPILGILHAEEPGKRQLRQAKRLDAEAVDVLRIRLGQAVTRRRQLRHRQQLRRRDRQPHRGRPDQPGEPLEEEPPPGPADRPEADDDRHRREALPQVPQPRDHRRRDAPVPKRRQDGREPEDRRDPAGPEAREDGKARPSGRPDRQPGRVGRRGHAEPVSRLDVPAQDDHRQDDRQPGHVPTAPSPEPAVGEQEPQRQPRRADEINRVARLEQDRPAKPVAQPAERGGRRAQAQPSEQAEHRPDGDQHVADQIGPRRPGIRHRREDQLARIQDRRRGVAQQGHPAVGRGVPGRHEPGRPLGLHPLMERIIVARRVPKAELLAPKQNRTKAPAAEGDGRDDRNDQDPDRQRTAPGPSWTPPIRRL